MAHLQPIVDCATAFATKVAEKCTGVVDINNCKSAVCSATSVYIDCLVSIDNNCWSATMRDQAINAVAAYDELDCGIDKRTYRVTLEFDLPSDFKLFSNAQKTAFCVHVLENLGNDPLDADAFCATAGLFDVTIVSGRAVVIVTVDDYLPPTIEDATTEFSLAYTTTGDTESTAPVSAAESVSVGSSASLVASSLILILASLFAALVL